MTKKTGFFKEGDNLKVSATGKILHSSRFKFRGELQTRSSSERFWWNMSAVALQWTSSISRRPLQVKSQHKTGSKGFVGGRKYVRCAFSELQCSTRNGALAGKVAIVTGSDRGIGRFVAEGLVAEGATVKLSCIDVEPARLAAEELNAAYPGANVEVTPRLDLADLSSVKEVADWFLAEETPLDILVNNAGANFFPNPWYTSAGIGGCAAVNFLGPYALTRRLLPALTAGESASRVVTVASVMHRFTRLDNPERFLRDWSAGGYRACKLAVILFTKELQRRIRADKLVAVTCDPGAVFSGIWATSPVFGKPPMLWLLKACYAPIEDGAQAPLWAAIDPEPVPGGYYARGLFACPWLASPPSMIRAGSWAHQLVGLFCSLFDWPFRWILFGWKWIKQCRAVATAPVADDQKLAAALWDLAASAADLH
ncbi:hypothetical protein CYMTET_50374 [Cymbomonas tetramitiformis]|uniref:Uncharacterized protein n=1 Tax=Cymbomonas tetramitiformis TaxID=36881 RepID=A0AAE0BPG9_9CHLO|nr:hypothetical protein CYMTET_50374 [Cymbomonas tetramitiformis]